MKIEELMNIVSVSVIDYTNYKAETSCNGGDYRFIETYERKDCRSFKTYHSSSSDFQMCPICGKFGCSSCKDDDVEIIEEDDLLAHINCLEGLDDFKIVVNEYHYNDSDVCSE